VIYNLDHNIPFERNKDSFNYTYKKKQRKYYPDFKQDDVYIEIKGYMTEGDRQKFKQFSGKLKVLFQKDLACQFEYVCEKYGV